MTEFEVAELLAYKDTDVSRSLITELFSNRREGSKILPPRFLIEDVFILKKGKLPNVQMDVKTTVGRYFFNMFLIAPAFGDKIPYQNVTIRDDQLKDIQQLIVDGILEGTIEPSAMGRFHNRLEWLKGYTGIFTIGMEPEMRYMSPEVRALKAKLIAENKDAIINRDHVKYVDKVEKPLLAAAKAELSQKPGFRAYDLGGKPKFGNQFKNMVLGVGPVFDPLSNSFVVSTNSLEEGIPLEEFPYYANTLVKASYDRGVSTQVGGEMTKQLFSALQTVKYKPNSDCGSTRYRIVRIDSKNYRNYVFNYIMDGGRLTLLTTKNIKDYFDKDVKMRAAIYCRGKDYCNVCMGDLFRRMNITNAGNATTRVTSTLLNLALKSMHDISIKTVEVNPFAYID